MWYCVLEGERGAANALAARGITLMANSGPLRERLARRSGRPVLDGISGIDLEVFRPDPSARTAGKLTVLAYSRRSRPKKGTDLLVPVRWVLNPAQDEPARLYASADVVIAAEGKAGWCNTAIEAMSAGAAVVCTPSGTRDFARHGETAWVVPVRHPWFLARGRAYRRGSVTPTCAWYLPFLSA